MYYFLNQLRNNQTNLWEFREKALTEVLDWVLDAQRGKETIKMMDDHDFRPEKVYSLEIEFGQVRPVCKRDHNTIWSKASECLPIAPTTSGKEKPVALEVHQEFRD